MATSASYQYSGRGDSVESRGGPGLLSLDWQEDCSKEAMLEQRTEPGGEAGLHGFGDRASRPGSSVLALPLPLAGREKPGVIHSSLHCQGHSRN